MDKRNNRLYFLATRSYTRAKGSLQQLALFCPFTSTATAHSDLMTASYPGVTKETITRCADHCGL